MLLGQSESVPWLTHGPQSGEQREQASGDADRRPHEAEKRLSGKERLGVTTVRKNRTMARKDSLLKLRDLLIKRRDALRKALAGDLSMLQSLREQIGSDVVDAALDASQDEISSKLAEVESRELGSIENALEQIRKGTYGVCEICDGKIPLARLQALPYATNCINCQRAAESSGSTGHYSGDWSRVTDAGVDIDVSFSDLETT